MQLTEYLKVAGHCAIRGGWTLRWSWWLDIALVVVAGHCAGRGGWTLRWSCTPTYIGEVLTREHKETFIVMFNKQDSTVVIDDLTNGETRTQRSSSIRSPSVPGVRNDRMNLSSTLSNSSNSSVKSRIPEFTDISVGAELLRFQQQQSQSHHGRHSFRRETMSLSSAIKNSLAMLFAYCTCSLPLIVLTVPDTGWGLTGAERVIALLVCRILFYLNSLVYPLWYLLFSVTVRKCFTRLWEGVVGRYKCH
ncbi:hypothetical protein Btru_074539 [Bulinus truncatus]|nr:hypothetical protein Btru_074539 [Bulinus truncatus]